MATQQHESSGKIVQSWLTPELAAELKRAAAADRRSVSAVIRIAVEDKLRQAAERPQ